MALRKRIGLVLPSTNSTCEPDYYNVSPAGVSIHTARMMLVDGSAQGGEDGYDRMNDSIEDCARALATTHVDVAVYGCTSGSFIKGPEYDAQVGKLIAGHTHTPVICTSPAVIAGIRSFGAKRVSVATPYADWVNDRLANYLELCGFEVANVDGNYDETPDGDQQICDQDPEAVMEFAARVFDASADAMLLSCTSWRALEIAEQLEKRIGKPVITSNQATIWAALKALGLTDPIEGYGQLLRNIGAAPDAVQ
ncbi:MAG: maleate cis-trans isomerase family protein [Halothiobacillaceae bacterium]